MSGLPEVRIFYASLLDNESSTLAKSWGWELESRDKCLGIAELYRNEWNMYEDRLLFFITDALGLDFYKSVIDVHLGQYFIPKSEPLIISFMDEPDQFVDTLAHELVHVLLTDNTICQLSGKHLNFRLADRWESMFGSDHSFTTLVHIPVQAVMQKVFSEFHKDESRKDRDIRTLKHFKSEGHLAAWDYVDKIGHQKIVDMVKDDYKKVKKELAGAV